MKYKSTIFFISLASILLFNACKTQKEIPETPLSVSFSSNKTEIEKGEEITLSWKTNADTVNINLPQKIFQPEGSITVKPDTTTTYSLTARKGLKTKNRDITVVVKSKPKPKPKELEKLKISKKKHIYSTGKDDGRFTIGTADGRRLMYGYPIPMSTSHIILKVDDAFASNYPGFAKDKNDTVYFSGTQKYYGEDGSLSTEITLMFDSVYVIQTLTPVDYNLNPVAQNTYGNYYLISYKIINGSSKDKKVGFMTLIDLMIDDNDDAQTFFGDKEMLLEKSYTGNQIPDEFHTVYEAGNIESFSSITILNKGKAHKPDILYLGQWNPFHSFVWDVETDNETFTDSGYLLKWKERTLSAGDSLIYSFYYGVNLNKDVIALHHKDDIKNISKTIYFKQKGSSYLDAKSKQSIDSLLALTENAYGILIEGYGDALGTEAQNFRVSKKRAKNIRKYLLSKKVDKHKFIIKPYGESNADQSEEAQKNGNPKDRKAVITVYY